MSSYHVSFIRSWPWQRQSKISCTRNTQTWIFHSLTVVGFARKLENEKFGLHATFNWRTYKTNRWQGLNYAVPTTSLLFRVKKIIISVKYTLTVMMTTMMMTVMTMMATMRDERINQDLKLTKKEWIKTVKEDVSSFYWQAARKENKSSPSGGQTYNQMLYHWATGGWWKPRPLNEVYVWQKCCILLGLKRRQVTCAYDLNVMKNFKPDEYMRVLFLQSVAQATRKKISSTEVE